MSEATRLDFAIASASYAQWLATGQRPPTSSALLDLEYAGSDAYNRDSAAKQELLAKALSLEPRLAASGAPRLHLLNAVRVAKAPLPAWSSDERYLQTAFTRALTTDPNPQVRYLLARFVADGLTPASWDSAVGAALATGIRSIGVMPWTTAQGSAVRDATAAATAVLASRAPAPSSPPATVADERRTAPAPAAIYTSASPSFRPPSLYLRLALGGAVGLALVVALLVARRLRSRAA